MVSTTGRYEVLEQLGAGGFGTVYRARFVGEGGFTKEVALKFLNAPLVLDAELSARLRDEARLLGLLRHRAILHVDTLTQIDGQWTIVMEYVEGHDLAMLLRGGTVPEGVVLEVMAEVAGALHAAYTRTGPGGQPLRLVHQDLKPSNIRLTPHGEVKVLDFGIARADFEHRELAGPANMGTLGYMAPERFDRGQTPGPASDIYALGAVAYELLTGRALGLTRATTEAHIRSLELAKTLLSSKGVSPEGVALVLELLARDPDARPSADALEARASALARRGGGESLRAWTRRAFPELPRSGAARGIRTGAVFTTMDDAIVDANATLYSADFAVAPATLGAFTAGIAVEAAAPPDVAPPPTDPPAVPQPASPPTGPVEPTVSPRRESPRWALWALLPLTLGGLWWAWPSDSPTPAPVGPAPVGPAAVVPAALGGAAVLPTPGTPAEGAPSPTGEPVAREPAAARTPPRAAPPTPTPAQPEPAPPPEAEPAPVAPPGLLVTVRGDARAVFLSRDGALTPLPARVPAGDYEVLVSFEGMPERLSGGALHVERNLSLSCDSHYGKCLEQP